MAKETKPTALAPMLSARMRELGVSPERLAEAVEVDVATVNRWLSGKTRKPDPDQIALICLELRIWPNTIMKAMYPKEMASLAVELGSSSAADVEATLASIPEFQGLLTELTALDPETLRALMLLARKAAKK